MNDPKYHHQAELQMDLNNVLDRCEDNLKVFSQRLAIKETYQTNLYYQEERQRLMNAIAALKEARNTLGSLNYV